MYHELIIAIVAAMLNVILSIIIPPILNINSVSKYVPLSKLIKKHYLVNRDLILISSVSVIIFVYISLILTPWFETNVFKVIAKMSK